METILLTAQIYFTIIFFLNETTDVQPLILSDCCRVKTLYIQSVCQLYSNKQYNCSVCCCSVGYESFYKPSLRSEEEACYPSTYLTAHEITKHGKYKVYTVVYLI